MSSLAPGWNLLLLLVHPGNFYPLLFRDLSCCNPRTVQRARVALGSSARSTGESGRTRGSLLVLPLRGEYSPAEERAYQGEADQVDTQCPPGLRIAAGAKPVNRRERKDAQRQHVQPPPPLVANALAQQGTDANSNPKVQADNTERHPLAAIMTGERNKYLLQPEVGEWIANASQDMHSEKNRAEQC